VLEAVEAQVDRVGTLRKALQSRSTILPTVAWGASFIGSWFMRLGFTGLEFRVRGPMSSAQGLGIRSPPDEKLGCALEVWSSPLPRRPVHDEDGAVLMYSHHKSNNLFRGFRHCRVTVLGFATGAIAQRECFCHLCRVSANTTLRPRAWSSGKRVRNFLHVFSRLWFGVSRL